MDGRIAGTFSRLRQRGDAVVLAPIPGVRRYGISTGRVRHGWTSHNYLSRVYMRYIHVAVYMYPGRATCIRLHDCIRQRSTHGYKLIHVAVATILSLI